MAVLPRQHDEQRPPPSLASRLPWLVSVWKLQPQAVLESKPVPLQPEL
jgi:hypothetical protein